MNDLGPRIRQARRCECRSLSRVIYEPSMDGGPGEVYVPCPMTPTYAADIYDMACRAVTGHPYDEDSTEFRVIRLELAKPVALWVEEGCEKP